jgi:hypothetical protein
MTAAFTAEIEYVWTFRKHPGHMTINSAGTGGDSSNYRVAMAGRPVTVQRS